MLNIFTLNIWSDEGPCNERLSLIKSWIMQLAPDIIGLQEVLCGPQIDQLNELFENTPYRYRKYVGAQEISNRPSTQFGNAIVSRWPLSNPESLMLPMPIPGDCRVALCLDVKTPWGTLLFTTTHLDKRLEGSFVRQKQVVAISEMIAGRVKDLSLPAILVGDFNSEPDSSEIRFFLGLHSIDDKTACFFDAWRIAGEGTGTTWSNRNSYAAKVHEPDRRLDYILVGPSRESGFGFPEKCKIVCDEQLNGVWPSDHFGLFAQLCTGSRRAD